MEVARRNAVETSLAAVGLVVVLLLVKEAGIPIPVPGDLLVLGTGVTVAADQAGPAAVLVLAALIGATIGGGAVQFALLRGPGRRALLALLARAGMAEGGLRGRGAALGSARTVAVARMTPGVRVVAIAAAALGAVPGRSFLIGLSAGNAVFVAGHFALGYVVGRPALDVAGRALGPAAAAALILAVAGGAGWFLLARHRGTRPVAEGTSPAMAVLSWADACCPACLTIAATRRLAGTPAVAAG